jgi:adenosylhomocysteinase
LIDNIFGSQEETTTGVIRLRALERDGKLRVPVVAINDTPTKRLFDNVLGTSQSTIDGILRATSILLAGKNFVVCGYGYCGSGLAARARGMGANVIVTEVDTLKALQATMMGYSVMPMENAAKIGDIFVTVTGNKDVIRKEHLELMKDGVVLANTGHFNVEISLKDLESISKSKKLVKKNVEEYTLKNGRRLNLLAEGRIVNLIAAEGHPSNIMDLSFSDQALCSRWIVENHGKLSPKVYEVPKEIDERVAKLKLESLGIKIDSLTPEQKKYLSSWEEGT